MHYLIRKSGLFFLILNLKTIFLNLVTMVIWFPGDRMEDVPRGCVSMPTSGQSVRSSDWVRRADLLHCLLPAGIGDCRRLQSHQKVWIGCLYVCMYVYVCVCIYLCMYVCMYVVNRYISKLLLISNDLNNSNKIFKYVCMYVLMV